MSASEPNSVPEAQAFAYQSLDLAQRSIRLIRILPTRSREGHIQCEMRHATVDHEYKCLSYVWGPLSNNWITINGQLHSVRDNLLALLAVAQQNSMSSRLWIDAICIDQINNAERTHQVQQMGHIFSRAIELIAWLGTDTLVANFFRFSYRMDVLKERVEAFMDCEYWQRAWVTQEIFLARRVTLMARNHEIPLDDLPYSVREISSHVSARSARRDQMPITHTRVWPTCFLDSTTLEDWRSLRGRSLAQLVVYFRNKRCVETQDRVYSILGLCGEGSSLGVDYSRSNEQLVLAVLLSCKTCFCLCSVYEICSALGVEIGAGSFDFPISNVWKHHHVNVSIPLAMPGFGSSEPEIPAKLSLKSRGLVLPATYQTYVAPIGVR
jgi:hypothetical protein